MDTNVREQIPKRKTLTAVPKFSGVEGTQIYTDEDKEIDLIRESGVKQQLEELNIRRLHSAAKPQPQ
jgi:hypothetical protein